MFCTYQDHISFRYANQNKYCKLEKNLFQVEPSLNIYFKRIQNVYVSNIMLMNNWNNSYDKQYVYY